MDIPYYRHHVLSRSWPTDHDGPHPFMDATEAGAGYSTHGMHSDVSTSYGVGYPPSLSDSASDSNSVTPTLSSVSVNMATSTPSSVSSPLPSHAQEVVYHPAYSHPFAEHVLSPPHSLLLSPSPSVHSPTPSLEPFYQPYFASPHLSLPLPPSTSISQEPTSFAATWSDPVFSHTLDSTLWSPTLDSGSLSDAPQYRPPSRRRPTSRRQHPYPLAPRPSRPNSYPSSPVAPSPSSPSDSSAGPSRPMLYTCPRCSRVFARSHDMHRHMRGHEPGCKHSCEKCGRSFRRSDAVKRHLKAACRGA